MFPPGGSILSLAIQGKTGVVATERHKKILAASSAVSPGKTVVILYRNRKPIPQVHMVWLAPRLTESI